MLTSLVYMQQGNVKKSKKFMKLGNISEENLHIFRKTWGTSMKFSGKMFLIIILKQSGLYLLCRKYSFEKQQGVGRRGGGGQIDPLAFLGLGLRKRYIIDTWQGSEYSSGSQYTRILIMPVLHKVLKKMLHHRCLTGFWIFLRF